MALLAGRKRTHVATSTENTVMCSRATLRITGMSRRSGITRLLLSPRITNNPASAIQLRIADVHRGGRNWTSCFVTDQFTPQASTTMRNRPTAAQGEREFIAKSLKQFYQADSIPLGA